MRQHLKISNLKERPMAEPTPSQQSTPATVKHKVQKTEAEWRELLTPEQFHVMREKGTERAFTGALLENHDDGMYHCAACNSPLFTSDKKFESGSGWPSFGCRCRRTRWRRMRTARTACDALR